MLENQDSYQISNQLPNGDMERKLIVRIPENESFKYKELGKGGGPIEVALDMAYKHSPNFYGRVIGYTVSEEGIGKIVQESMKKTFPNHPQSKGDGFTYTFYEKL